MRPILLAVAALPMLMAPSNLPAQAPQLAVQEQKAELRGIEASDLLSLTDAQRPLVFRNLEQVIDSADIAKSTRPRALPAAKRQIAPAFDFGGKRYDVDAFMRENRAAGVLVLDHGEIALERYALGNTEKDRWASFSVTKSISSTLIGAAVLDGKIAMDDSVVKYLPELKDTPYTNVTVRNLVMMASGVDWNEDYTDPKNDLYSMMTMSFIDHAKTRRMEHDPGSIFHYNTADANLQTLIVERATGKPAQDYLHEKIWEPFGMADDAKWTSHFGHVTGGSNLQMTLRDYGRFGQFFLEGGKAGGKPVVPADWTQTATEWMIPTGFGDVGYGYTWWANPDGSYRAIGIYGQTIYVNPARQVVVVFNSAWPDADWALGYARQDAFVAATLEALR